MAGGAGRGHGAFPWRTVRFWAFGKIAPACIYSYLGFLQLRAFANDSDYLIRHPSFSVGAVCLEIFLYALFSIVPALLFLLHGPPAGKDYRWWIRGVALIATFMLLLIGTFAPQGPRLISYPVALQYLSLWVIIAAMGLALFGLSYLRTNFSLSPEAREFVKGGPYHYIRHPLYAAEILASLAALLSNFALTMAIAEIVFVALQVVRMKAEEKLLSETFPEYRDLIATTKRIVPFVW